LRGEQQLQDIPCPLSRYSLRENWVIKNEYINHHRSRSKLASLVSDQFLHKGGGSSATASPFA
jgi:hypothetical protein